MKTSRSESLRAAVLDHDREMLRRDPKLVAGKYARMARTPFTFFRGTAWLYPREPSAFSTAASSRIAVMGDPHPENVGTVGPTSVPLKFAFNDFDLANYGSYVDDLRRLALGLYLTADLANLDQKQQTKVVAQAVEGYADRIGQLSAPTKGKPGLAASFNDVLGGDVDRILNKPDPEDLAPGPPASPADVALAEGIVANYLEGPHPTNWLKDVGTAAADTARLFAIKHVSRRNAGVASFPVDRLQVTVEGPTPAPADDWTLELKESLGQPARLIVAIQEQFNSPPNDDPFLGWAGVGGREFRLRRVWPEQRRLSVDRIVKAINKDHFGKQDLRDLAFQVGRMLATGHSTALDRDGKPGVAAVAAAITSNDGLRDETVAHAQRQAALVKEDFRLFNDLLAKLGPTLGWQPEQRAGQ